MSKHCPEGKTSILVSIILIIALAVGLVFGFSKMSEGSTVGYNNGISSF